MRKNLDFELKLWESYSLIAGVDEAGRGALAGPIVVAAVILPQGFQNSLIQDSKILSPIQRIRTYQLIKNNALEYKVIIKETKEVEIKNPLVATQEAMKQSINSFIKKPDLCLVDGKEEIIVEGIKTLSIIGGDRKSINIAAASIIAKVIRDGIMKKLHKEYPFYHWRENKGYPNKEHLIALFRYGICKLHRKTYEPIKSLLKPDCNRQQIWEKYKL